MAAFLLASAKQWSKQTAAQHLGKVLPKRTPLGRQVSKAAAVCLRRAVSSSAERLVSAELLACSAQSAPASGRTARRRLGLDRAH